MIIVISPAKKLDLSEDTRYVQSFSTPDYLEESKVLVRQLSQMTQGEIGELMSLSDNLASLNHSRYQQFEFPFTPQNSKQAVMTFNGDVYQSLELEAYTEEDYAYAQAHVRILSGLYGLLRPLDLIQAYRLEMGTRLQNERGRDLYAFWGNQLAEDLNQLAHAKSHPTLVNLASNEYAKAAKLNRLDIPVITPHFKDIREGKPRVISFFAKQARGAMTDFAIKERVENPEELKHFQGMGYTFDAVLSTEKDWVFTRVS
ncbi:MAG: peroxide stress protein YaaA [Bacteroidota bacterium]